MTPTEKHTMNALHQIQQQLSAPKNQRNSFGGYNYRSCEDILTAVKPLLDKTKTTLVLSDEVSECAGHAWVKATAALRTDDGSVIASVTAWARHAAERKGMDDSQITGATSSYARKYALNGLFAIDDTKDSDATNKHDDGRVTKSMQTIDAADGQAIAEARQAAGLDTETVAAMMREAPFSCQDPPHDLLKIHVPALIERIDAKAKEKAQ